MVSLTFHSLVLSVRNRTHMLYIEVVEVGV